MKLSILFFCTIFLLASCKENINSVKDVMKAMSPDEQKFTIDPATDNIIKGEKGTQIFIPANALKFPDGTAPTGSVKVELKEFFSTSDFASNNLSTVSDSFLLETGGMLYIAATAAGKELVIDNNKSYAIAFPKSDSTKDMELFYGESAGTGNVNWQQAFQGGEGLPDTTLDDSSLYERKITACGYTSGINGDTVLWQLKHPDSNIYRYIENNFKPVDTVVINSLCERGERPGMVIEIDEQGKVSNIDFDPYDKLFNQTRRVLRKPLADFFFQIPAFKMESMAKGQGRYVGLVLCCHTAFNREKYKERFDKKYSQYRDKAIEKIDSKELNFYVFSATKFGWINCDRFYLDEKEKIDFIVNAPSPSPDSKTFIVFDSINSIMSGTMINGKFVFPNVPVNSKVKLIGINFENGKPGMAVQQAVISKNPVNITGFKSFTISELEKQLNKS